MSILTVEVSPEFTQFATRLVAEGRYATTSEVLQAAMEALQHEQQENRFLEALAEEGEASGTAEGDIFAEIRAKYGWPQPDEA